MGIVIEKLLEDTAEGVRADIIHGENRLRAELVGSREQLTPLVGALINSEFNHEQVVSSRVLDSDELEAHGLSTTLTGTIRIVGCVIALHEVDAGSSLIDVYSRTGPEFFLFTSLELGGVAPSEGTPLEVLVTGLRCVLSLP